MFTSELVEIDRARLEVFGGGDGQPPICVAHPFQCVSTKGGGAMEPLSRIGRTLGVNLRAMGRSTEPSDDDLLSIIAEQSTRHQMAVAGRVRVSSDVAEALADTQDEACGYKLYFQKSSRRL